MTARSRTGWGSSTRDIQINHSQSRPLRTPPPSDTEFARLLRAARKGDEHSWSTLYGWLAPQILGFLRSARMADSEDIVGEVFLEVAGRIADFKGDARGFRAWVFTIARGRRVDDIRRRTRSREERFDTMEHVLLPAAVDVESDALETLVLEDLLAYLDLLTVDQSEVLMLRVLGDLTSREVAEMTGRTVGSVEQLHHRATTALREILGEA